VLNINDELWLPIKEVNGLYQISNMGNISNYRKNLKTHIINSGYKIVGLKLNGVHINRLMHRLVANSFIDNPEFKREVNHIDGDKLNNKSNNLEWVTSSENKRKAYELGLTVYNVPTLGLKLSSASKYHNVGYDKIRGKWTAGIRHKGKTYYQKRFTNEKDAAIHVNWALDQLQLFDRPRNIIN
jgi:HNH endonuclease/NUMOD4 motif